MTEQTKSAIKTRSQEGVLVNRVDNPDRAGRVKMTNSELDPTAEDLKALESTTKELKARESEVEKDETQGRLKAYSDTLKMRAVLETLTDTRANTTAGKDKIIKAWKKATRNMENTENSLQERSEELLEEIKLAKEDSEPDSEQIGIVKARVKRAVEGIRT